MYLGTKLTVLVMAGYMLWVWTPYNQDQKNYIDKYKGLAIREMERSGVPASITMAQALLESNSGKSDLARKGNNHFGIKCHSSWNGETVYKKDDDYKNGKLVESCFRSYPSVDGSYKDHSDFLRNGQRYQFLFDLDITNYEGWARGLKKAGYATSQYYHRKLIDLIETYGLYELDKMSSKEVPFEGEPVVSTNPITPGGKYLTINDVKYVLAKEGETVDDVSERVRYSTARLLRYNEGIPSADYSLKPGDVVYVQPKRRNWRGRQKYHTVTESETMYDIAQQYGISIDQLYRRNRMMPGEEPADGARIKIRGGKVKSMPEVRASSAVPGESDADFLPEIEAPEPMRPSEGEGSEEPQTRSRGGESPVLQPTTPTPQTPATPVQVETQPEVVYHTVVEGETLWRVSQKYKTTVAEIKRLNGIVGNVVSPGMVIRVK